MPKKGMGMGLVSLENRGINRNGQNREVSASLACDEFFSVFSFHLFGFPGKVSFRVFYLVSVFVITLPVFFSSCRSLKDASSKGTPVYLDTVFVSPSAQNRVYHPSRTIESDLLHTRLDVRFDWEKQYLYGKAILSFKPYFYPQTTLNLDAKGFTINRVSRLQKKSVPGSSPQQGKNQDLFADTLDLKYSYDNLQLHIFLDNEFTRNDTFFIYVDYISKPNERESGGSAAISSDKGLYFINADGSDSAKPRQIWTQGETEASSCWFPTIDAPNEKMTQEIYITVDKQFLTLSNGILQYQSENGDNTRTDYWKQDLPHSPYLTVMAIGDYAVVKDKWRNMEVSYYVEKEYEKFARNIFGNTPEMLEFFSKTLGVDYPWEKFSQVVVRDYVSGAMENTTVVVHGEFLQQSDREMLDNDFEDVISHELFHHWFGNLVTCESWANLPLNESFATMGEYLWIDYKYGRDDADYHLQQDFSSYFSEASRKQENLIRFNYSEREDMFDRHSYQKGGIILNMLRRHIGDEAFFESLKLYLNQYRFKSAEVHNLRLAFEEVTGEDLNWFFNQWFLSSGHPELIINYEYTDSLKQQKIIIEQKQDLATTPLYRLPLSVDIYVKGRIQRHKITVENARDEFKFVVPSKPDLVNVDAPKMLLCEKKDNKDISSLTFQYYNAPLYLDRYEALIKCAAYARKDTGAAGVVLRALNDSHWNIRSVAMRNLEFIPDEQRKMAKTKLMDMAVSDRKSAVRAGAIRELHQNYKDEEVMKVYHEAIEDMSFNVIGEALIAISEDDMEEGMKKAREMEKESGELTTGILSTIAGIYAEKGGDAESGFFENHISDAKGFGKISFVVAYEKFLKLETLKDETVNRGIEVLRRTVETDDFFYVRLYGIQAIKNLENEFTKREMALNEKIAREEKNPTPGVDPDALRRRLDYFIFQKKKLASILDSLRKSETNREKKHDFGN